jgi:acetyl esterase/lipase
MSTTVTVGDRPGILYTPSSNTVITHVALFLHGGCFQDGDETWNRAQCADLTATLHLPLLTLHYRQDNIVEVAEDCHKAHRWLREQYPEAKVGIIGGSSGGFYALFLAGCPDAFDFCVALCPVADPYARYQYLLTKPVGVPFEDMCAKQLRFFRSEFQMRIGSESVSGDPLKIPTLVIVGDSDRNVPLSLSEDWLRTKERIEYIVLQGGHELCSKPSVEVTEALRVWLLAH